MTGFPPSLLFVGGDEIMLDDSRLLHEKLMASGSPSTLVVAPGLWHAYILYVLKERREDLERIAAFCRDCCRGQNKIQILAKALDICFKIGYYKQADLWFACQPPPPDQCGRENCMEKSRSWSSAHDWKSCIPQKRVSRVRILLLRHIKEQTLIQKQPSDLGGCFCIYARKA